MGWYRRYPHLSASCRDAVVASTIWAHGVRESDRYLAQDKPSGVVQTDSLRSIWRKLR